MYSRINNSSTPTPLSTSELNSWPLLDSADAKKTVSDPDLKVTHDRLKLAGVFYILFGLIALPGLFFIGLHSLFLPDLDALSRQLDLGIDLKQIIRVLEISVAVLIVVHVAAFCYVGWCFIKFKHHTTCVVAAIFACLSVPLGTALGVCSLILLTKPEAKRLFGKADHPPK